MGESRLIIQIETKTIRMESKEKNKRRLEKGRGRYIERKKEKKEEGN